MIYYLLFFFFNPVTMIKTDDRKLSEICHTDEKDFWNFYYYLFLNTDHLQISIFEIENNSGIIQDFLNQILIRVSSHKTYKKSFTISKYNLETLEPFEETCQTDEYSFQSENDFEEDKLVKIKKIQRYKKQKCFEEYFYNNTCPDDNFVATDISTIEMINDDREINFRNETELQRRIRSFSADLNYR